MFKSVVDKPGKYINFCVQDELVYLLDCGRRLLCIPKGNIGSRSTCKIIILEAHSVVVHLGASKTSAYLQDHVYWKDLLSNVKLFCELCQTTNNSMAF